MKKLIRYGLEVFLMVVIMRYWFKLNQLNVEYLQPFAKGSGNNIVSSSLFDISGYLLAVCGAITLIILLSAWNGWAFIELHQSFKIIDVILVVFNLLICILVTIEIKERVFMTYGLSAIIALHITDILLVNRYFYIKKNDQNVNKNKNIEENKLTYTQAERTEIKKNAKKVAGLLGENFSEIEKEAQDMQTDHFKVYADDGQKRLVDALQKNNFSLAQLKGSKEDTQPESVLTDGSNKEENNNESH